LSPAAGQDLDTIERIVPEPGMINFAEMKDSRDELESIAGKRSRESDHFASKGWRIQSVASSFDKQKITVELDPYIMSSAGGSREK